ncbi:MAG: type II secretion system F family protein [Planctomycetota bacterium]|nr:type II secretion system F family protein [Planctomycetota bacterium]
MPTFSYEALDEAGKPTKDTIVAANTEEAIARIRSKKLFPTSVREQKVAKKKSGGGAGAGPPGTPGGGKKPKSSLSNISIGGVSRKGLTTFTRQLSTLQDAGLPILRSLSILEQQQKPGLFKNIIAGVHEDVSSGSTLSDAMAQHPKAFDRLYCKMIAAGEVGGVLDLILQRLAEFMEKAAKLKGRIIGAMIYPAVVISVAALIVTGIMLLIVPKFEKIFEDFQTTLPPLTLFLMRLSRWLGGTLYPSQMIPGAVFIVVGPFVAFFVLKFVRKTPLGKAIVDTGVLYLPVAGKLITKSTIARFTRTLGTLINAGVPILDAILITRDTTANYVYVKALDKVHDSVRQGESFAEPLRQSKTCDSIVVNMIDVGEETGDLDKMLMKIADNYDEEVDVMVDSLVSLLEPIMVVLLGAIVGFIVVALFLPMVKLISALT